MALPAKIGAGGRPSGLASGSIRQLPTALIFLLPAAVILGVFNFYPALYSLYLSLFEWNGISPTRDLVGLGNYRRLFASPEFWNSLRVTAIFAGGLTVGSLAIGLLVAVMLNLDVRGRAFYRAIYFLPVITPTVAAGVVWKYLFDPSQGVINRGLAQVGIDGPAWLVSPGWALVAVIIVAIWKRVGFNMVIYLAALQGIPRPYYEAAQLDGANALQVFRYITVPLLAPSTFFLTVTGLIEAFQVFDLVYVMTAGGPLRGTDVMGYYLYRYGFRFYELGFASAIAYVMFLFIFVVTLIQFRITRSGTADG